MPPESFVHLRVHSAYSLSEGAIKVEKIPALAKAGGMPAVAITDTHNLFGALEFSQACLKQGVQPIVGCQLSLSRPDNARLPPDRLVVLAMDEAGLANLQRLSSSAYLDADATLGPHVTLERLRAHAAGLFLLTGGGTGPLFRLLADGQRAAAETLLAQLTEAFPDRIAMELHRHGLPAERAVEPGLIQLADAAGVPLVATNDAFFSDPAMHLAHDALLCIAEGRLLSETERRRVTDQHWFKPPSAMRAAFADVPDSCDNTLAIARLCSVWAETRKPLLPTSPKVAADDTAAATLARMAHQGLARRMAPVPADQHAAYAERLDYELGVIGSMGFADYFLIVADFIQWAKAERIPVGPGRGSGAGSVAAWALAITDLDPTRFGLLFERFLNPERVSMPDFDIDFCQDRRDEVIAYVRREYGADRVAQIITFGKLQARAAVRDVGRVLGLPFGQVNRVAELIPNNPAKPVTLQQAIDGEKRLQDMRAEDEQIARLLEIALQLEGLYRHASTHAAGVVIGDRPLSELVPLYRDPRSEFLVTQYNMKWVEQAGLVKFDFLGLTTLTILQRAVAMLRSLGTEVDLDALPLDDAATYAMLQKGDAGGVFQFESQGMRDALRQIRPDRFEDLIAIGALYRPGPMANIPAYAARKHGEPWAAPHPAIHDVLAGTYGIMVYQEQVMRIAQEMAGYSLGAADLLRRAMGKKIRAEMEAQRKIFIEGAVARGITPAKATEVFDLMEKFADYGFNKSHAAAYALIAYQTGWMKANHPAVFIAACMSLALANTDKLAALKAEADRAGIAVLPPCVNASDADFTVERQADGKFAIRYALAAVKKVGLLAMRMLVAARGDRPFQSLGDLADRLDPGALNKMQIENLARAGAFDRITANRAAVFAAAESLLRRAQAGAEERASGQIGLFGGGPPPFRLPEMPDWPELERLSFEAEAVGFHLTGHPLDAYATTLRRLGVTPLARLAERATAGATRLKVAGTVVNVKERRTRTGNRMAWVRLSDASGSAEITLFSEVLSRTGDLLAAGTALLATVEVDLEGDSARATVQEVAALEAVSASLGGGARIWFDRADSVPHIRTLLEREGRGRGRVFLVPKLPGGQEVAVALPGGFNVSPRLRQALKLVPGVETVAEA